MTAATAGTITPLQDPGLVVRTRWAVRDTLTITRRNLLVWMRVPAYIVFTVIQPVLFVLMFRYVFGGAIHVGGKASYCQIPLPRVLPRHPAFPTLRRPPPPTPG